MDRIVEDHLKYYLERAQFLWNLYNESMDEWMLQNPESEGAPNEGSFATVGITKFSRHGFGIRIDCEEEIVEFDFIPSVIKKNNYLDIEEIDIYWSYIHYKSLNKRSVITEDDWVKSIKSLDSKKLLTLLKWNKCAFNGFEIEEES